MVESLLRAELAVASPSKAGAPPPLDLEAELSSSTLFKLLEKLRQRGKQVQQEVARTACSEQERISQVLEEAAVRETEVPALLDSLLLLLRS